MAMMARMVGVVGVVSGLRGSAPYSASCCDRCRRTKVEAFFLSMNFFLPRGILLSLMRTVDL